MSDLRTLEQFAERLRSRGDALNRDIARIEGAREAIARTLAEAEERVAATGDEAELLRTVLDRLQQMEKAWQRNFQRSLETVVSDGLSVVFGEKLEVRIVESTKADMSTIDFRLKWGKLETSIMDAQGGGYVAIIAFLLRVLLILAAQPVLRRLVVLDEPFAHVSPEYRRPLADMVAALIERLGFQIIMVTQEREYVEVADEAYSFTLTKEKDVPTTNFRSLKEAA